MSNKAKMILASASPRRRELLEKAGYDFDVVASDAEEIMEADLEPAQIAMRNAEAKAADVQTHAGNDAIVIGADTIVVLDGTLFGKPKDAQDARRMLEELSGRSHQVVTGVCVCTQDASKTFFETTHVFFKELDGADIDAYIATGEPMDKAGAYGIQGKAGAFVDHIDGSYANVVGLPMEHLQEVLDRFPA